MQWGGNPALQWYLIILGSGPWAWEGPRAVIPAMQEDFMHDRLAVRPCGVRSVFRPLAIHHPDARMHLAEASPLTTIQRF